MPERCHIVRRPEQLGLCILVMDCKDTSKLKLTQLFKYFLKQVNTEECCRTMQQVQHPQIRAKTSTCRAYRKYEVYKMIRTLELLETLKQHGEMGAIHTEE